MTPKKPTTKVVSLSQKRHARLTLQIFDQMEHAAKRGNEEKRAEVERKARETN